MWAASWQSGVTARRPPRARVTPRAKPMLRLAGKGGCIRSWDAPPAVHGLQKRIADAFTFAPAPPTDLEDAMRQARAIHRANVDGVRAAMLDGEIAPAAAARWISSDVETCVATMLEAVLAELQARHGRPPGGGAVLALGKLGGRELALGSDIDLIFVCEASDSADQNQAAEHYHRAAQQLFAALARDTEAGRLYDVDMRLRPFGADGPLAVLFSSFTRYYRHDRWTWELQALTRARVLGDDSSFGRRLSRAVTDAVMSAPPANIVRRDVARMRRLMAREQPATSPWDLKRVRGGLIDLEFIVQALQLMHVRGRPEILKANTGEALSALADAGILCRGDADRLMDAWRLYSTLRQLQGALGLCGQDPRRADLRRHQLVLDALGADDWRGAKAQLGAAQTQVRHMLKQTLRS